jgi:hypothetical protein
LGAPHQFWLVLLTVLSSELALGLPSSQPWATRKQPTPHLQHNDAGLGRTGSPSPGAEGGGGGAATRRPVPGGGLDSPAVPRSGAPELPGDFFGRESLLRETEGELECPLLTKRCAPRATALWPEGAILVRRGSPPGTKRPSSGGLSRFDSGLKCPFGGASRKPYVHDSFSRRRRWAWL